MTAVAGRLLWVRSSCARAGTLLEEGGLVHLVNRALHKAASPFLEFGSVHFFVRDLQARLPEEPFPRGVMARQAREEDLPRLLEACHPSRSPEALRDRIRRGQLCFVAEDPLGIAQTCWVAVDRERIPEMDLEVVPGPREVYLYDGYTPPGRRGHGLYRMLRRVMFSHLAEAGYQRAHFYVRGDNLRGRRGAEHLQRRLGVLRYFRFLGGRTHVLGRPGSEFPTLVVLPTAARAPGRGLLSRLWRSSRARGSSAASVPAAPEK